MLDTDMIFKFDGTNDEFVVNEPSESYVFVHRQRPDGNKTRFYTRNFAYAAIIVAENLRRYIFRERSQTNDQDRPTHEVSWTFGEQSRH